jgi:hypothetical protein
MSRGLTVANLVSPKNEPCRGMVPEVAPAPGREPQGVSED